MARVCPLYMNVLVANQGRRRTRKVQISGEGGKVGKMSGMREWRNHARGAMEGKSAVSGMCQTARTSWQEKTGRTRVLGEQCKLYGRVFSKNGRAGETYNLTRRHEKSARTKEPRPRRSPAERKREKRVGRDVQQRVSGARDP